KRFYQAPHLMRIMIGVGAVVALGSYLLYGMNYIRLSELVAFSRGTQGVIIGESPYGLPPDDTEPPYAVTRYDIVLDVKDTPTFQVMMDVSNTGADALDRLTFTLMEGLAVH